MTAPSAGSGPGILRHSLTWEVPRLVHDSAPSSIKWHQGWELHPRTRTVPAPQRSSDLGQLFLLSDHLPLGRSLHHLATPGSPVADGHRKHEFQEHVVYLPPRCQAVCFLFDNCWSFLGILSHNFNIYGCNYSMFTLFKHMDHILIISYRN